MSKRTITIDLTPDGMKTNPARVDCAIQTQDAAQSALLSQLRRFFENYKYELRDIAASLGEVGVAMREDLAQIEMDEQSLMAANKEFARAVAGR